MSDFASSHMRKHGWTKGKGLGKKENGRSDPIKVKIKADTAGIGHDPGKQFTFHWWEHAFEKACKNIKVHETENGIHLSSENSLSETKLSKTIVDRKALYGRFIKSGVLDNGRVVKSDSCAPVATPSDDDNDRPTNNNQTLTDDALFNACGGRTAHKGARHGLRLSGKLARLAQQESSTEQGSPPVVADKAKPDVTSAGDVTRKPAKKLKKKKKKKGVENRCNDAAAEQLGAGDVEKSRGGHKKKKKKRSLDGVENIMSPVKRKRQKKLTRNTGDT